MQTLYHIEEYYISEKDGLTPSDVYQKFYYNADTWEAMESLVKIKVEIEECRTKMISKQNILNQEFQPSRILILRSQVKFLRIKLDQLLVQAKVYSESITKIIPQYLLADFMEYSNYFT